MINEQRTLPNVTLIWLLVTVPLLSFHNAPATRWFALSVDDNPTIAEYRFRDVTTDNVPDRWGLRPSPTISSRWIQCI